MSTQSESAPRTALVPSMDSGSFWRLWEATARFRPVLFLTLALFVYMSATQEHFLTTANLQNLMTSVSVLWVAAIGMTFVVLSGGFDLSIGAVAALSSYFMAQTLQSGLPAVPAMILAVAFGALVGAAVNGFLVGRLRLNFFVVTLASMTALAGVVNLWSGTVMVPVTSSPIVSIGVGHFLGLPIAVWIMLVTLAVGLYVLLFTYFGRDVMAVGGNLVAARLSGIRVERTLMAVYGVAGAAAAVAGIIATARIGGASPQVDLGLALSAAAAVLLGGTSLAGGSGGVGGTAIGVLFIGVLQNGLSIAGVQSYWQQIVTGVILVTAVLGDAFRTRRTAGTLPWRRPSQAEVETPTDPIDSTRTSHTKEAHQ